MALPNLDNFKASFKGDLVTPNDPEYPRAIARFAANAQRRAALVVFPKDVQDISETIKWVSTNKIPLAVCGGGHSTSGASSVEDGVVIALSRHFGAVRIEPERRLAYVGGGALWAAVDKAAIEHGLATPGGTVNHTGVGGLTLGGGYGYLTSEHGLVIDNLEEATIVTGDGSVVKASGTENIDLFWGIRGGGGNFGVATEFVLRLHPQRRTVYSGFLAFPGTMVQQIFAVAEDLIHINKSPKAAILLTVTNPPPERRPMLAAVIFFNGSEEEGRRYFKALFDLGPLMEKCSEMPYEYVNGLLADFSPPGRGVCMTGAIYSTPDVPLKVYNAFLEQAKANPEFTITIGYEFFDLDKVRAVSHSATAFPARQAPPGVMLQVAFDGNATNIKELEHKGRNILRALKTVALGGAKGDVYANYDHGQAFDPLEAKCAAEALFKANYPRLQNLKARYDPNLLFSRWFGIEPVGEGQI